MKPTAALTMLAGFLLPAALPAETRLGNIVVAPFSPGALRPADKISATLDFQTDEPDGVLIFALPTESGQVRLGTNSGSAGVHTGSGSTSFWATVPAGFRGIVDRILVVAVTPDQSRCLCKVWIPVEFHIGDCKVAVTGMSPAAPAALLENEDVTVTFDYAFDNPNGANLWTIPSHSNGANQGSAMLSGSGSATRTFRLQAGLNQHLGDFRVLAEDRVTGATFASYHVPVRYYWSTVALAGLEASWSQPAGQVTIHYSYRTTEAGFKFSHGPILFGGVIPGWTDPGYPLLTGAGTRNDLLLDLQPADIPLAAIHHVAWRASDGTTLLDFTLPLADMRHRADDFIASCRIWPGPKAVVPVNQRVHVGFTYQSADTADKFIFVRPMTGTELASGYQAHGSPVYTAMSGSGEGGFYFPSGTRTLTAIRVRIEKGAGAASTLLLPVELQVYEPTAPALRPLVRSSGDIRLEWASEPYENYRVWRSLNLASWEALAEQTISLGVLTKHTDPGGALLQRLFYRVERKNNLAP